MNKRAEAGLLGVAIGYLLGGRRHRRHHPLRDLASLLLFNALLLAAIVPLALSLWPYLLGLVALVAALLLVRARHRRQRPRWPSSSPPVRKRPARQLPPSQDRLDAAFAAGCNRGQREARKVEASWRSLPAYDPDDPDSF